MNQEFINFFNSNFFVTLTTLLVGGVAIWLYIKQKKDQKREAAEIILMEIRAAERTLSQIKEASIGENIRNLFIMPVNNWNKYNHLFVKDFDRDEWDSINSFYSKCTLAEKSLEEIRKNLYIQLEHKAEIVQSILGQIAKDAISDADYEHKKEIFLKRFEQEGHLFRPNQPLKDLITFLNNIPIITTSTIGIKLKKIAKFSN